MPGLTTVPPAPTAADENIFLPPKMPSIPIEVLERFDSMQEYDDALQQWWSQVSGAISDVLTGAASTANAASDAITNPDSSLNDRIDQVSSVAGGKNAIFVQGTAPTSPKVGDLWVDTADQNKYEFWDGSAWQYKQDQVLAAAVSTESSTRATADGFLSGKYTLTVVAGNVVTGMNITSSSGGGTNVSNVTFQASSFLIYNGSSGNPVFSASGGVVYLASTLVVDQANSKVYIGIGTYANAGTQFYVDSTGKFSLGANLTWNGTTLAITGNATFSGTVDIGSGLTHTIINGTGITFGDTSSYSITLSSDGTSNLIGLNSTTGYDISIQANNHVIGGCIISLSQPGGNNTFIFTGLIQMNVGGGNNVGLAAETDGSLTLRNILLPGTINLGSLVSTNGDGWTPKMKANSGSNEISFKWTGSELHARVDSTDLGAILF